MGKKEKKPLPPEVVAKLARYTKGEEIFNAVTHIVGGAIGVAVLVLAIIFAVLRSDGLVLMGVIFYGVCMIILYTMSAIYHFLPVGHAKAVFRIFDHCTIFLLIAGTYSPICLFAPLRETGWGWWLFGFVWAAAVLGITFNAINMHNRIVKIMSQIMYILIGWCAVVAFGVIVKVLPLAFLLMMIAGGVAYTSGVTFYALGKKKKYFHSIWHLFCLAGTVVHFVAILLFVVIQI